MARSDEMVGDDGQTRTGSACGTAGWGFAGTMGSIGWYIFRTTFAAFLLVLGSLTPVIWITQALREIDLITTQGQTVFAFIGITSLAIPVLVLLIAPIALLIAVAHVLNKLGGDSEIIVMNAAGMTPARVFRAFLAVALAVSVIVSALSVYLAPKSLRAMRDWGTQARANLLAHIVQPGRFTSMEQGLVFHIRERRANGTLAGILVDDARVAKERVTILAEEGEIVQTRSGTFLIMHNGTVQRQESGQRDPAIVAFDRTGFDLSRFAGGGAPRYTVREQYLWQLAFPNPNEPLVKSSPAQYRAEFHDRLTAPLYPIAFVVIAFMYLGPPRTNRQSRTMALVTALCAAGGLRLVGFASSVFGLSHPAAFALQYIALIGVIVAGSVLITRGVVVEPPAFATRATAWAERWLRPRQAQAT